MGTPKPKSIAAERRQQLKRLAHQIEHQQAAVAKSEQRLRALREDKAHLERLQAEAPR